MKPPILLHGRNAALLLGVFCGTGLMLSSAGTQASGNARPSASAASSSNAPSATVTIPLSVFLFPNSPVEGRDPFFPSSTRRSAGEVVVKTNAAPPIVVELQLKGISGPSDRRLAIINNRTLQKGEEAEVSTGTGRVRIRCLDIKAETAVVQVGSERRELRLRPGI